MAQSPTISIGYGASNFSMDRVNLNTYHGSYQDRRTIYKQEGSQAPIFNGTVSDGVNARQYGSMRHPSRMETAPAVMQTPASSPHTLFKPQAYSESAESTNSGSSHNARYHRNSTPLDSDRNNDSDEDDWDCDGQDGWHHREYEIDQHAEFPQAFTHPNAPQPHYAVPRSHYEFVPESSEPGVPQQWVPTPQTPSAPRRGTWPGGFNLASPVAERFNGPPQQVAMPTPVLFSLATPSPMSPLTMSAAPLSSPTLYRY